jgi:hypothetical protein
VCVLCYQILWTHKAIQHHCTMDYSMCNITQNYVTLDIIYTPEIHMTSTSQNYFYRQPVLIVLSDRGNENYATHTHTHTNTIFHLCVICDPLKRVYHSLLTFLIPIGLVHPANVCSILLSSVKYCEIFNHVPVPIPSLAEISLGRLYSFIH